MMAYRPHGRIWEVAAAPDAVVDLDIMRAHLQILHFDDDAKIVASQAAAVEMIERYLQRLLIAREAVLRLPGLPCNKTPVELPGGRVAEVASVVAAGLPIADTTVVGDSPALLLPASDWPILVDGGYPAVITYTAGFAAVPADIVAAVKLATEAIFWQHDGGPFTAAVISLLERHRIAPVR